MIIPGSGWSKGLLDSLCASWADPPLSADKSVLALADSGTLFKEFDSAFILAPGLLVWAKATVEDAIANSKNTTSAIGGDADNFRIVFNLSTIVFIFLEYFS